MCVCVCWGLELQEGKATSSQPRNVLCKTIPFLSDSVRAAMKGKCEVASKYDKIWIFFRFFSFTVVALLVRFSCNEPLDTIAKDILWLNPASKCI